MWQALAFGVLVICTTILEVKGYKTSGLWTLIVFWALFGDFNK